MQSVTCDVNAPAEEVENAVVLRYGIHSSPPSFGMGMRVARIAHTIPQGSAQRQSVATALPAAVLSVIVRLCHHTAQIRTAATAIAAFSQNRARRMFRGVQMHFARLHAIERAWERRRPMVNDLRRDSALRITTGELERRPGALNRMV